MMNSECFNGGLRQKSGGIVLTIYSTPLARLLLDRKINSASIKFVKDFVEVRPGTSAKLLFERQNIGHPITTCYIGRFLPEETIAEIKKQRKQKRVPVKLINIATRKEINQYNKSITHFDFEKVNEKIPENEKIKVACNISCFRTKSSIHYRLNLRHKIFEEIARKREKIAIARDQNGDFIIRKDKKGVEFNFYKPKNRQSLAYISLPKDFISENEEKIFLNGKRSISFKAFISSKEFNLDISKFFAHPQERELAYALIQKKLNIRIPEMRVREADIILKNSNTQIEVTTISPLKSLQKNNAHGAKGVHINARICEGFLRVNKKIAPKYVFVFDKRWVKYKWVDDLVKLTKPNVDCIPTDFNGEWAKEVAQKIKKLGERI